MVHNRATVAGPASAHPDYDMLSPEFAQVVRRDLPVTQILFRSKGRLKSVTFRGSGVMGDTVYDLMFANSRVTMSAALDAGGKMVGGILKPGGPPPR